MANEADVYVKNLSNGGKVIVERNGLNPEEIAKPNEASFSGFVRGEYLTITPPDGVATNIISVKSMIDVELVSALEPPPNVSSCWELRIRKNCLPQEAPTTVNVTIGDD